MPRPEWSLWGVRWSGGARFGFLESLGSRSSLRSWGEPGSASPTQRRIVHSSWDCPCHTWILCLLSNFLQDNFLVYGAGQGPLGSRASPVNFNSVSRCGHPPRPCILTAGLLNKQGVSWRLFSPVWEIKQLGETREGGRTKGQI